MFFEFSFRLIAFVSLQIFASFQADFSSLKDAFNNILAQPPSALRNLQSSLHRPTLSSVAYDQPRPHSVLPTGCGQSFATHCPICLVLPIPEPPPPPPPVTSPRSKSHLDCGRCYPFHSPACPFVAPSEPVSANPTSRPSPLSSKIFGQISILIISLLHTWLPIIFPPHLATLTFLQNLCGNLTALCHQVLPKIILHKYKLFYRQSPVCIKALAERYRLRYSRRAKLLTKQVQRYRRRNLKKTVTIQVLRETLSRTHNSFVDASNLRNDLVFENEDLRDRLDDKTNALNANQNELDAIRQREVHLATLLDEQNETIRTQEQQLDRSRTQHATRQRESNSALKKLMKELGLATAKADQLDGECSKQVLLTKSCEQRIEAMVADLDAATTSSRAIQQELLSSKIDCDRWREEAAALHRGILTLNTIAEEAYEAVADETRLRHCSGEDFRYQIALVRKDAARGQLALTETAELERRGLDEENLRLSANLDQMAKESSSLQAELVLRQAELDATRQALKVSDAACVQIVQTHWQELRQLEVERGSLEAEMANIRNVVLTEEDVTEQCRFLSQQLHGLASDADELCGEIADQEFWTREAVTALEIEETARLEDAANSRFAWESVQAKKISAERKLEAAFIDNAALVAQIVDLVAEAQERSATEWKTIEWLVGEVASLEDENIRLAAVLEVKTEDASTSQAEVLLRRAELDETREAVIASKAACVEIAELHWQEARQWDIRQASLEAEVEVMRNCLVMEEAMNEELENMVQGLQDTVSVANEDIADQESDIKDPLNGFELEEQVPLKTAQSPFVMWQNLEAEKASALRKLDAATIDNGALVAHIARSLVEIPKLVAAEDDKIEQLEARIATLSSRILESDRLKELYKSKYDTSEGIKVDMQNRARKLGQQVKESDAEEVAKRAKGLASANFEQLEELKLRIKDVEKQRDEAIIEKDDASNWREKMRANVRGLRPSSSIPREPSEPSSPTQIAVTVPTEVVDTDSDGKGGVSSPRAATQPRHPEAPQERAADGRQKALSTVLRTALPVETPEPVPTEAEGTSHRFKLRPVERPRKHEEASVSSASPLHLARQALKPVNKNGQSAGKPDRRVLGDMTNEQK